MLVILKSVPSSSRSSTTLAECQQRINTSVSLVLLRRWLRNGNVYFEIFQCHSVGFKDRIADRFAVLIFDVGNSLGRSIPMWTEICFNIYLIWRGKDLPYLRHTIRTSLTAPNSPNNTSNSSLVVSNDSPLTKSLVGSNDSEYLNTFFRCSLSRDTLDTNVGRPLISRRSNVRAFST